MPKFALHIKSNTEAYSYEDGPVDAQSKLHATEYFHKRLNKDNRAEWTVESLMQYVEETH